MAGAITEGKVMCERGLEREEAKDKRGHNLIEIHSLELRQSHILYSIIIL